MPPPYFNDFFFIKKDTKNKIIPIIIKGNPKYITENPAPNAQSLSDE